jgi:hypothetical protein
VDGRRAGSWPLGYPDKGAHPLLSDKNHKDRPSRIFLERVDTCRQDITRRKRAELPEYARLLFLFLRAGRSLSPLMTTALTLWGSRNHGQRQKHDRNYRGESPLCAPILHAPEGITLTTRSPYDPILNT